MIALLLSPIARAAAGVLAIALLFGAVYLKGYSAAKRECAAQTLARQLAEAEAEIASHRKAASLTETQTRELELSLAEAHKEVNAYAIALENNRNRPVCRLDAGDIGRLRPIR